MLDSIVGTFLTQNVSDTLSSKAFMTLASRFPNRLAPLRLKHDPLPVTPLALIERRNGKLFPYTENAILCWAFLVSSFYLLGISVNEGVFSIF